MPAPFEAIREAGRVPIQRNTFYEPVKVCDSALTVAKTTRPENAFKARETDLARG